MRMSSINNVYQQNFMGNVNKTSQLNATPIKPSNNINFSSLIHTGPKEISQLVGNFPNRVKFIGSDIDGTLLDDEKKLLESTELILKKLAYLGIKFSLVSGRSVSEMEGVIKKLPSPADYLISQHGAVISDKTGKVIFQKGIPAQSVQILTDRARAYREIDQNVCLMLYSNGKVFHESPHSLKASSHIKPVLVSSLNDIINSGSPTTKMMLRKENSQNLAQLAEIQQFMSAVNAPEARAFGSSTRSFEIIHPSVSKGNAIEALSKILGIDLKNMAGIGDAGTDVDVMNILRKHDGLAISMDNGDKSDPAVIAASMFKTGSNNTNGFYNAMDGVIRNNDRLSRLSTLG